MDGSEYDEAYEIEDPEPKAVRISLHLIQKRHLPPESRSYSQEKIVELLNEITHLRLDRENIGQIDNLELLGDKVTNVYLQQNRITEIENLDCLTNLLFLTLSGNRIKKIEGLTHLSKLMFLDISDNQIEEFDIDELPQSLKILDLRGNPCTQVPDYRGRILQDLAKLQQLDGQKVTKEERQESGFIVSSESEEEGQDEILDDEEFDDQVCSAREKLERFERTGFPENTGSLQQATNDMLERSQVHLEESLTDHRQRMAMLDALRVEKNLPPSSRREKKPQNKSMGWTAMS